ncbi:prolyl-tRNA synthetase associated domain-containing protein [Candidatus Gracilibacteria bacterium]|nr:MAG: prolyl-tRNA synthetase associated domain-containing protein [Candidatus Gracilibacteria bacterium]
MQRIFDKLDELKINYENFSHNPTFTCAEARNVEIPGKRVKSLLLNNKNKQKFFMIVLEDEKRLDVRKLQKVLGEAKLSFMSGDLIFEKTQVKIGHVSPFALINNLEKDIKVIFDLELKDEEVGFHPLRNDNTVVLNLGSMEIFLKDLDLEYFYLEL